MFCTFGRSLTQNSWIRPIKSYLWMIGLEKRLFFLWGQALKIIRKSFSQNKVQPLEFYFWHVRLGLLKSPFLLVKVNICGCIQIDKVIFWIIPTTINHGTFFPGVWQFRYVLVNSHLIHPPSKSWLLTLGILQAYPLSKKGMIDFLMPYIHRLIDQPPLNHNWQKLVPGHCTSGSFQEIKVWAFLGKVWYSFPGPRSCPGNITHYLLHVF